ncbi:MAG: pirin family protein [Bacteroidota bacterium]
MANNKMLVEERSREVANFLVGRLLPFRKKRQVGPFTFIDHMGPGSVGPGRYSDVDQHPHIGLSTLTYLYEGSVEHRDSAGHHQIIGPGDIGFMTAGKGITHTERTPASLRDGRTIPSHGYQIWVALPVDREEMEPTFQYLPGSSLPRWQENHLDIILVAGAGFGRTSPLQVYSPLFMVDVRARQAGNLDIKGQLQGEIAIVVVKGSVIDGEDTIEAGQMLISKTEDKCQLKLAKDTQLLLFGGAPLPEPRYLYWNFVSSRKERLEQAKQDWESRKFPKIQGDDTYIPLPK